MDDRADADEREAGTSGDAAEPDDSTPVNRSPDAGEPRGRSATSIDHATDGDEGAAERDDETDSDADSTAHADVTDVDGEEATDADGGSPDADADSTDEPAPSVPEPERTVPEDVRKYERFTKMDGAQYDRVNEFLRDRTYITAREWAIARLCADFRTETGVEMTKIGENLPDLVPFMTDTYTPQAVNQARSSFDEKVRMAGATFLYGAMCDFYTAEELDDVMYEVTEVSKFLLEVEGVDLSVEDELEAEERISSVMREVREASKQLRDEEEDEGDDDGNGSEGDGGDSDADDGSDGEAAREDVDADGTNAAGDETDGEGTAGDKDERTAGATAQTEAMGNYSDDDEGSAVDVTTGATTEPASDDR